MPGISTLNIRDNLSHQVALSRLQSIAPSSAERLSASARLSLATRPAPQAPETGGAAAFAQAKELQKTAENAKASSNFASGEVLSALGRTRDLLHAAAFTPSAENRNQINEELSQLKTYLGNSIKSFAAHGGDALYEKAATGSNNGTSAQSTVLASDANAENGVLTKSYSGTTEGGSAYSYHLLSSAASSSSSEISVSATTSNEELYGMIAALDSMIGGTNSVRSKLSQIEKDAYQSSNKALQDVVKQSSLPIVDLGEADNQRMLEVAKRTRDLVVTSGLPIANFNMLR